MAAQLQVAWPLVVLHGKDKKHHYEYRGAAVEPVLFDEEQIESLLSEGALVDPSKPAPKPAQPATAMSD